jgi:hypothetical protein
MSQSLPPKLKLSIPIILAFGSSKGRASKAMENMLELCRRQMAKGNMASIHLHQNAMLRKLRQGQRAGKHRILALEMSGSDALKSA